MVPVPLAHGGGWPEQQVDELFASLLGRGVGEDGGAGGEADAVPLPKDGFRVFG